MKSGLFAPIVRVPRPQWLRVSPQLAPQPAHRLLHGRAKTMNHEIRWNQESRTPAGDRPRPAYGRGPQCQLDDRLVGDVSSGHDPHCRHRRDGALVSARRWLCLQASDLDPQTQGRGATRLRGKRLRVEVILAGAGTPTPPPVTHLVDADLLD